MRECLRGQRAPLLARHRARTDKVQDAGIIGGLGHDEDGGVVLRGGAHQRWATDVDIFQCVRDRHRRIGDRLDEGIEIRDDHIDRRDAVARQRLDIVGIVPTREDAAMHGGMQRLHPPAEDFREIRDGGDAGHRDACLGGFFRYSTTRDWSIPHYEKMLEDNAKLTSVYALASVVLGDDRWLDVVKSAHGWLLSDMRDPQTGAFAGSQDADAEEHYYGQPLAVRATLPTPYIDRTVYAGWNALLVSALVERYKVTGETEVLDAAQWAWNFLDEEMHDEEERSPEDVILHHFHANGEAQGRSGLLADQIPFIQSCLDLYDVLGHASYLHRATQAMGFAFCHLEDKENGGFYDLPPEAGGIGELARPKKDMERTPMPHSSFSAYRRSRTTPNTGRRPSAR